MKEKYEILSTPVQILQILKRKGKKANKKTRMPIENKYNSLLSGIFFFKNLI